MRRPLRLSRNVRVAWRDAERALGHASAWGQYIAGAPRMAEEAFSWGRPAPDEDLFYVSTPGPGYSEGGDIF